MQSGDEQKDRVYLFDNLKTLLIFFVVYGHVINSIYNFQGIEKSLIVSYSWIFIYSFHMPLFVFLSSFFSKKYNNYSEKTSTILITLLIPYLVFNTIFYLMNRQFILPLLPDSSMWYLYALIIWRLFLPIAVRIRFIIPITIFVSLLMNVVPLGVDSGTEQTIKYFPFFLMGYYTQTHQIKKLRSLGRIKCSIVLFAAALLILVIFWTSKIEITENILFVHSENLGILTFFGRCLSITFGMIISLLLLVILPDKKLHLSFVGKNTLLIYLLHYMPLCRRVYQLIIPVNSEVYSIPISILVSFAVVLLFGSKPFVWGYRKFLLIATKLLYKQ